MSVHLVSQEFAIALEMAGVLSKHVNLNRSMALAAAAPQVGALMIQEVIINGVFVQDVPAAMRALLPDRLAIIPHVADVVIILVQI